MSAYLEPLEDGPRCKKWNLIVSAGSGKDRRRKSRAFEGGKRDAIAALKEFEKTTSIPAASSSFEQFATQWNNARYGSGAISQSTHDKYRWFIKAVDPYLVMSLENIRPSDVQAAYAALRGSWSGTSLRSLHNSLNRIFRAAISEGRIISNPMADIDPPKNDTKEKTALTPQQAQQLLDALDIADNRQFAIALILRCGLRRCEVIGAEWRDVNGSLHLRRETTKSDSGVRDIPLDEETRNLICKRQELVQKTLEGVGDTLHQTDKLCCGLDGRPLTANALRLYWQRYREKLCHMDITLHELRHTYLTNLAQANVHPAVMQKLAGHSNMATTMQIYTHVHQEDMQKAVDSVVSLRQSARKSARKASGKKTGQDVLVS